jgi:cytoskeleton protein RodZ
MSESDLNAAPAAAPPTAGRILHNARRAAGMSLDDLAARVKVPVSRLQALENDQFEEWPNKNLLRALAASVARHVRLDPAIVLNQMPNAEKVVWSAAASGSSVGFTERDGLSLRSPGGLARLPLALLALALVVAALAIYFGPRVRASVEGIWTGPASVASPAAVPVASEPVLPPDAGPTDTRVGAGTPETPSGVPTASGALTDALSAAPAVAVAVSQPVQAKTAVAAPASMAAASASTSLLLVFKASGMTWVAVTDAKGAYVLRKTLGAGETATASGDLPLWVVVGRVDHTEVLVRGKTMKLEPTAPDNVARFKVQ